MIILRPHLFLPSVLALLILMGQMANSAEKSNISGFFVSSTGHVLTHTSEAESVSINFNDKSYSAKVVKRDAATGLTLLKIDAFDTPFLPISDDPKIELGDPVFTIGFPDIIKSRSPRYSKGVIHSLVGDEDDPHYLEVAASLSRGNSGAAVLNKENWVVGVLSIEENAPIIAYKAVKSDHAKRLIAVIPEADRTTPDSRTVSDVRQATVSVSVSVSISYSKNTPKKAEVAEVVEEPATIAALEEVAAVKEPKAEEMKEAPIVATEKKQPILVKAIPVKEPIAASLTTRQSQPSLTLGEQIDQFLVGYFQSVSKGDMNKIDALLSPGQTDLYELHQSYLEYWPIRKFEISNSYVEEAFFDQVKAVVDYQYIKVDKQGKSTKGSATNYFTIQNRESGFRIVTSLHVDHSAGTKPTETMDDRVNQIITEYMVEGCTGGKGASHLFADSIHYYGSRKSRAAARVDEANYNNTWPKRFYCPSKPHQLKPIENGRYYANAYSKIGASNGYTHKIIDTVSSFIIDPGNGTERSLDKIWLTSTKERLVSAEEFAQFCRKCNNR